jgi:glycosyltransferase involved in cell wall biosynthesis
MSEKVSVIIPSYNTAQYIGEALDSVNAQTFPDFETIVVNDGSPDTLELERVLEPYRDRITYICKSNGGLGSARNAGIAVARGSLIAFLDSDDTWDPSFLQALVEKFQQNPGVDVVYSNSLMFSDTRTWTETGMDLYPTNEEVTFTGILLQRVWVLGCAMVRAETLSKVGGFDPNLRYAEDLDLWLRIAHGGGRFAYVREPLLRYRRRPGSLTAKYQRNDGGVRAVIKLYESLSSKLNLTAAEKVAVDLAIKKAKAEITGLKPAVRRWKAWIRAALLLVFPERWIRTLQRRSAAKSGSVGP